MSTGIEVPKALDAIPVVQSTADRATRFPTPADNQRVQNLGTGAIERFSVASNAWLTDFDAGSVSTAFNVKAPPFGAKGDGTTDDTAAIQSAVTTAATVGGVVFLPPGTYLLSSTVIVPATVTVIGAGQQATFLKYTATSGFALKLGNNAGTLSYGITASKLAIQVTHGTASALWLYGVADCAVENVYIEGVTGATGTIGVQIDGANVSAFFILLKNVHCNHVFKGFVHTTTGTTQPTQVTGINCTAYGDNTTGSIGLDVQAVGGLGCGDGVVYLGGDMEACKTGVSLAGSGTTLLGMRFENPQGTSSDITFASTARNNQVLGGSCVYTITDTANHRTNQVIGVPKDETNVLSQPNKLDTITTATPTTASAGLTLPHGTAPTSPQNGDLWTTASGLFVRINGVTKTVTLT